MKIEGAIRTAQPDVWHPASPRSLVIVAQLLGEGDAERVITNLLCYLDGKDSSRLWNSSQGQGHSWMRSLRTFRSTIWESGAPMTSCDPLPCFSGSSARCVPPSS